MVFSSRSPFLAGATKGFGDSWHELRLTQLDGLVLKLEGVSVQLFHRRIAPQFWQLGGFTAW